MVAWKRRSEQTEWTTSSCKRSMDTMTQSAYDRAHGLEHPNTMSAGNVEYMYRPRAVSVGAAPAPLGMFL
jgi:hypothetical protein